MSSIIDIDQIFQYYVMLTSTRIKNSVDSEEVDNVLSSFTKRFNELFEKIKEKKNETQVFHAINPIFVISLEESLIASEKKKEKVTEHLLAVYKMMLEDFVLEPQRRFMSSSNNPWSTFIENTRKRNKNTYENEFFNLLEVSSTDDEFTFNINRCIYQEIFKEFGREDLGPIMCEYDSIIADNVSKWVKFEREETIAEGFPRCTFKYFKVIQKFTDNPFINKIHSLMEIIDNSEEMVTQETLIDKGFEDLELKDIIKLIEAIQNHPCIKTLNVGELLLLGNTSSLKRYEEWNALLSRKTPKDDRTNIIRKLSLNLSDDKLKQMITHILDNPYELSSIKWVCLSYLQNYFSSELAFESEGVNEFKLTPLLEEYGRKYPEVSFKSQSIDQTRVSIHIYGRGVSELKLKEFAQLLRKTMFINYPEASFSIAKPVPSNNFVSKKVFEILEDINQPFQLRELALRILISRVGNLLVSYLITIAENKKDDPFLRGRAVDSLSWLISSLPQIFKTLEEFKEVPVPVQRSIVDFVARQGMEEDLLLNIAINENIVHIIRIIAIRNLQTYQDPKVTEFLLKFSIDKSNSEYLRQASLEALEQHYVDNKGKILLFEIFTNSEESSFIRMEAFETLKILNFKLEKDYAQLDSSDWITSLGIKQIMEG
jgi:hypothetical protein